MVLLFSYLIKAYVLCHATEQTNKLSVYLLLSQSVQAMLRLVTSSLARHGQPLLKYDEAPEYVRHNPYIRTGYRYVSTGWTVEHWSSASHSSIMLVPIYLCINLLSLSIHHTCLTSLASLSSKFHQFQTNSKSF